MSAPGSLGRLGTAARFLLRSLELRRSRFLLAFASIAVGVSVAATALDLRADVGRKMTRDLRAFGANLVVSSGAEGGARTPLRPAQIDGALAALPGAPAAWLSYVPLATRGGGSLLVGIEGGERARDLFGYWRVDGAWPAVPIAAEGESAAPAKTGTAEQGCLVGSRLAARLGAKAGDPVEGTLPGGGTARFVVTGLVRTGESEEDEILVPGLRLPAGLPSASSADAPAVAVAPPAVVLLARVEGTSGEVDAVAHRLEAIGVRARAVRQVSEAEGSLMGRLELMLGMLSAVLAVLSALCVGTTLVALVVEREPEIGLMRSLGAGDGEIVLMVLGEATLLGLAGGAAGFLLGALHARLVGWKLFGVGLAAHPGGLPVILALSVALCWIAGAGPLRRALRVRPAEALRGE